jgi:membrane protease YdiL (CAAX protease family)
MDREIPSQPQAETANDTNVAHKRKIAIVPWHPALAVVYLVLIFFLSQIVGGIIVGIYSTAKYGSNTNISELINNSTSLQFTYILVAESVAVAGIFAFLKWFKTSLKAIGLRRPKWSDLGYGLLALPVYYAIFYVAVIVIKLLSPGLDVNQEQAVGFDGASGALPLLLTFISLVVLPPIAEEIMVRGYLYTSLRKKLSFVFAGLISSALFAAAHLAGAASGGLLWIAAIDTFTLALMLVFLRERTGGLWACMTLHAAKNSVAFYLLFIH